jgi:AraC family transcriptional regulator, exoenzyme S synthesis regulatory protein ExsA
MQTLTLPNFFKEISKDEIFVYLFENKTNSPKTKVELYSNLLCFVIEGSKETYYDNDYRIFNESHFLLARAGKYITAEQLADGSKYKSLFLFFSDQFLIDFKKRHHSYFANENLQIKKPFAGLVIDAFIKNYIQSILLLLVLKNRTCQALLQLKLEELFLYLIARDGIEVLAFLSVAQETIKDNKFTTVIETNLFSRLTLEELAFLCNMSLSTFKREFEKNYDCTPMRWFQNKRLEYCASILNSKKQRPSDVYHVMGYESLASFTRAFKLKFGVTPKKFQSQEN